MANNANRYACYVIEKAGFNGNHRAFIFVRHAGEIAKGSHCTCHVEIASVANWVAGIKRFDQRQVVAILLYGIGQFAYQHTAIRRRHGRPSGESFTRCGYGAIYISRFRFSHFREQRIIIGIEHIEGAAIEGIHEFVVDEELGLELGKTHGKFLKEVHQLQDGNTGKHL